MTLFLARSRFARVTSVLGPHYRYSSGLFSTTPEMKIPTFGDPNKYLNRTEERNEKHRKESCREAQAIMSYLKPQVLFLQLSENKSSIAILDQLTEFEKYNATDLVKAVMNKPMVTFRALIAWSFQKYVSKIEASLYYVAYREAKKYGSKVVFGDRPTEITRKRLWRKRACNKLLSIDIGREIMIDERDKYMAHRLLKVARNNSSVVAIVGELHLEGIKKYWEQPIEVQDLMTIPLRRPTLYNSFLSWR